ncbi:class Ib ribonucleoside-diphosphate reductase assembly flavoprotein NrdI [Breoghania sp.]|uniref:class Ib ribonucleoside-diphosphate reductase assembly flavoprotein NrdI n=1 Tax=Breoghania sp. TaxID=2065378 RepID=UPI002611809C|nr:class Ib ribonucleoside-diphosphate reductase assembly flavoprotein NrdI [Breoghania sp.]MDJ0933574.1 class Ib ribonucleoside-diphosphate reductase assembly flavoprotein NrdI [Breoghania sp.]
MSGLVYFSSASGNTHQLITRLGLPAWRIPKRASERMEPQREPSVLVVPTYADGKGRGAVPKQVICFLNEPENRALLKGVIASGNTNFGRFFAYAGDVVSAKCKVPLLYRFELSSTEADVDRITQGMERFWKRQS